MVASDESMRIAIVVAETFRRLFFDIGRPALVVAARPTASHIRLLCQFDDGCGQGLPVRVHE
jgi:hypothetical protein